MARPFPGPEAPSYHRLMLHSLVSSVRALRRSNSCIALLVMAGSMAISVPAARADDYTDRANKAHGSLPKERRSDLILLPLLAKLEAAPKGLSTLEDAMLLPAGSANWAAAAKWAEAPAQQAVIKALGTVTAERDWKKAFGFGQPYGIEGVDLDLIQAGLFTDLGDPPTLAAARIGYLPALDKMAILCQVEATRLAASGKVNDAIDLLTNLMCFGRQMADRSMFAEVRWGLTQMQSACERLRDVVYTDGRGAGAIDLAKLKEQIKKLEDKSNSYLDLGRVSFPVGDRAAAEQLTSRIYKADGSVDEQIFASTMSRLGSTTRPLRLFSESGKWRSLASSQGPRDEAAKQVDGIFSDWAARWTTPWFDKRMSNVVFYSKFDKNRFAALAAVAPDMGQLQDLRQLVRVEVAGTRSALAVAGHHKTIGKLPPQLTSVRPAWLLEIDVDPYNPNTANAAKPAFEFFVPIRDTAAFDGKDNPHEMEIVAHGSPFQVKLKDDVFVLYSVGSDNARNNAKRVQNTSTLVQGADYLIWPPVVSLVRQNLTDRGDLK
jgi:hypothetical protein